MSKPTEAQLSPVERVAQATAGTLGSRLNRVAFDIEQDLFPTSGPVLQANADQEIFGLPPNPLGSKDVHLLMFGLVPNRVNALVAASHIARGAGIWNGRLGEKYLQLSAALGMAAYLDPDQASSIMDGITELTTHKGTGELLEGRQLAHLASGAPHKGMEALSALAVEVSGLITPLNIIELAKGDVSHPIVLAQRAMHGEMRRAVGIRTAAGIGGGIFGALAGNPVCLPVTIVPALHGLTRGDTARLDEVIGGKKPNALQAWQQLWTSNPEIVDQFIHRLCVERAAKRCKIVEQTMGDAWANQKLESVSSKAPSSWYQNLPSVVESDGLRASVEVVKKAIQESATQGMPLSDVLGMLSMVDAIRRPDHRRLPDSRTDLSTIFGAIGDELSDAVKNAPQDKKLMLALPAMMRIAIAVTRQTTNVFKTTGDTALERWSLSGYDDPLIKLFMDTYNGDSFHTPVTDYTVQPRLAGFDAIVAQTAPSLVMDDLCVLGSFAKGTGHVTNMLTGGELVIDPDSTRPKSSQSGPRFTDAQMQAEYDIERAENALQDPAEVAKHNPSSSENVFSAMMALSALKYYRNRADIFQKHFVNETEGDGLSQRNMAFFNAARNNLDLAARNIIDGIIKYTLKNVELVKSMTSSTQAGDDWVPVKTIFTFMDWAQREFPNAFERLVAKPLETMLSRTGQSGTAEPWSSQIALFMGRIANQNRFGAALQKTARDHLVTMFKDTLEQHLSPSGKDAPNDPTMPTRALATLDILEDVLDPNQLDDEHKMIVLKSIEGYLTACTNRTIVSTAAEHAGRASSHPSQGLIQARNDAISKALNEIEKIIKAFKKIPTDAPSIKKLCQNIASLRPVQKT